MVIGIVETHGRAETAAQLGDLEQVPRRRIQYHDVVLEEMDLDGVLRRQPTVALVDELAHTSAAGSRNPKRYQDVEEFLRAGIHVISTLNIQHLESLHDIVEQATGVKVKERIPDYVVSTADQIVNVDLSAEDLRERLEAGKVYPPERINTALENFFQLKKSEPVARDGDEGNRPPAGAAAANAVNGRGGQRHRTSRGRDRLPQPQCRGPAAEGVASGRSVRCAMVCRLRTNARRIGSEDRRIHPDHQVANTLTLAQQLGGIPWNSRGRT